MIADIIYNLLKSSCIVINLIIWGAAIVSSYQHEKQRMASQDKRKNDEIGN